MSTALRPPGRPRSPSTRRSPLYPVPASAHSARRPVPNRSQPSLRAGPPAKTNAAVRRLPSSHSLPLWLKLLVRLQSGSMVVTFILVVAALIVYGSTVYTQQLWSKEYRKLKTLQRSEREMIAATEVGKHNLAQQAERPGSGLVPQTPDSTIFLQPAPPRPVQTGTDPSKPEAEPTPDKPLGY